MLKTCIKCGHVNPQSTGSELEACPACGVIYAKAQPRPPRPVTARSAADSEPAQATLPPPAPSPAPPPSRPAVSAKTPAPAPSRASQWADSAPATAAPSALRPTVRDYVHQLRGESLYPTFRAVINFGYGVGIVIAVVAFVVGLRMLFIDSGTVLAAIATFGSAVMLVLFVRTLREASIMLADLSDAAVRTAMQAETRS